ncbi:XRE family transcriptional regulator [Melioribacter sp. Ez-97]|uniref:XRE family transcriptional regulator n=1 Tax=Melioribacter sp. Ez-97 TaxID=3423434 RepID=UPI003ED8E33F
MKNSLGKRIYSIRKKLGLNQTEFALSIGLSTASAISLYETDDREPDIETLKKIAEIGDVDLGWLITGQEINEPKEAFNTVFQYGLKQSLESRVREDVYRYMKKQKKNIFPIVTELPEKMEELDKPETYANADFISLPYNHDKCAALTAEDDSMAPTIMKGDFIIVDMLKNIKDGNIAVIVNINGSHIIRRIKHHEDFIIVYSDNQKYAPDIIYRKQIKFMKKVVKIIKDV